MDQSDFRDEHDLIRGTEAEFLPPQGFALIQVPGHEMLRRYLKIESVEGMQRFRRKSGALPRVILVPSGSVLRARAEEITEADR